MTMPDGYVPPSVDANEFSLDDGQWEANIELKIKSLNGKVTVALAVGVAGIGLGLLANFASKKIMDALGEHGNMLGTLYQVESQRGTFGNPIAQPPAAQPAPNGGAPWRPDTSGIGTTRPQTGPVIDESKNAGYEIHVDEARSGPESEASQIIRQAIASDPLNPAAIVKDEGVK